MSAPCATSPPLERALTAQRAHGLSRTLQLGLGLLLVTIVLSACVTGAQPYSSTRVPIRAAPLKPRGDVVNLRAATPSRSAVDVNFPKVPSDAVGFYFIRPASTEHAEPYHIFVDTRYATSLYPGTWSYVELCPGEHLLHSTADAHAFIDTTRHPHLRVQAAGGTAYFVAVPSFAQQGLVRLNALQAAQTMRSAGRAVHTLPRLPGRSCAQAPAVVATIGDGVLRYHIGSDILFDLDRHEISPRHIRQATAALRSIVLDLRQRGMPIDHLDVQGHSAPQGSPSYSLALSQRRAQTVAQFFQHAGAPPQRVHAIGLGARDVIIRNCAKMLKSAQREACDQPNHRIEVIVHTQPTPTKPTNFGPAPPPRPITQHRASARPAS